MTKRFKFSGKYKALMIDLDGTTVAYARDALPTNRVTDAITKAKDHLYIGIATSRFYSESRKILHHLDLSGPSVVAGGAQIIDTKHDDVLWEKRLSPSIVSRIITIAQSMKIRIGSNDEETGETLFLPHTEAAVNPLSLWSEAVNRERAEALRSSLSDIATISVHNVRAWEHGKYVTTINHASATKQTGIAKVAEILGINTHEIIGVGDSYNDFPLLMACGLKIAMGNAASELKAIADFVAPSVDDDGVATVIEKFILEPAKK